MAPHLHSMTSPPRGSPHRQSHSGMLPPRGDPRTPPKHPATTSARNSHPLHHQQDLRTAYKAQTKSTKPGGGVNSGQSNKYGNGHHHNQIKESHSDDQRSMSSMSGANSGATPSSVYMPSVPLTRDFSDLSGVSGGTSRGSKGGSVPGQIFDPKLLKGPWRQAYNISNVPPEVSQSDLHNRKGDVGRTDVGSDRPIANSHPSIWVPQNDVVEIFDNLQDSLGLDRFQMQGHNRIPVMILLMNPTQQSYELMQIWVDRTIDSIRDLVHALQHKLPDKWKQAYDGIFQSRGHRFTQLINIIRLVKYDIQPHEILVAKPWSMTAKMTIEYAGSAIRHLTNIGVISKYDEVVERGDGPSMKRILTPKPEEAPLILSKKAQDRVYFPEGILSHHHAVQFITFSPPFESTSGLLHDDILHPNLHERDSSIDSQNSQYRNLHDDMPSCSLDSEYSDTDHHLAKNVLALIASSKGKGSPSTPQINNLPASPNSVTDDPSIVEVRDGIGRDGITKSRPRVVPVANNNQTYEFDSISRQHLTNNEDGHNNNGVKGLFSKLNCCRSKEAFMMLNQQSLYQLKRHHDGVMTHYGNNNILPETSLTSLSEEEEQQWLAYNILPIAEDQSVVGGHSVVSMSTPLLSTAAAVSDAATRQQQKQQQHGHLVSAKTTGTKFQRREQPQQQSKAISSRNNGYGFGKIATTTSEF